jgi:hydrogenase/urease accessory protein HupE
MVQRLTSITVALIAGYAAAAAAHPVPFSFVDVRVQTPAVEVTLIAHVFDVGHDLGIAPPERLLEAAVLAANTASIAGLVNSRLRVTADGRSLGEGVWSAPEALPDRQSIRLQGRFAVASPPGSVVLNTVMFPYDPIHQTFVNFYEGDAIATQAILDRARSSVEFFAGSRQGVQAIVREFVPAGLRHVLIGAEHLIFLFGLLLLGGTKRHQVLIASAFTIANALTLTLAALNIVRPSLRFVEPGIALSIVYVGADNLMVRGGRDVRVWIATAFGLIHGFGYAAAFRELNLSGLALGWSLFSFNLGLELAQLLVTVALAAAFLMLKKWSEPAGRHLAFAGSILVIAAGTVWFVQRVFFPGGMA